MPRVLAWNSVETNKEKRNWEHNKNRCIWQENETWHQAVVFLTEDKDKHHRDDEKNTSESQNQAWLSKIIN